MVIIARRSANRKNRLECASGALDFLVKGPEKSPESVDITGICGYNVSVILDKYALAETRVLL